MKKRIVSIDRVKCCLELAETLESPREQVEFPRELMLLLECHQPEDYVRTLLYQYYEVMKPGIELVWKFGEHKFGGGGLEPSPRANRFEPEDYGALPKQV